MKAVFIDTGNLYYCVKKDFSTEECPNPRIDFKKYLDECGEYQRCLAYVTQQENESQTFINYLSALKITTNVHTAKSTYFSWSVGMAVDVMNMELRLNHVILGTSDRSIIPLINWIRTKGCKVTVFAKGIPFDIINAADECINISEKHLQSESSA